MGMLCFKAELLDDVVLSQRTATAGDHKSLDFIPGSVFLGIAASRIYSSVAPADAWTLFHTSRIRFCNAYPLVNGTRALPMPLSFHSEKVPRKGKECTVLNFVHSETKEVGIQYKQNRGGYVVVSDNGMLCVSVPSKTSRMRTAINPATGSAAKSQLYGYESLDAGQVFVGKIEWDDSIRDIAAPVIELFESGAVVHAGRSKTASYGRIRLSKTDCPKPALETKAPGGTSFSILAVSDLCLRNPLTGTPELNVSPSFLGLGDGWALDQTRSFSRPAYLYQYNAHRKEIEIQKTLISKGSVFTFKSEKVLASDEKEKLLSSIRHGIGDAKGQGFGELSLFEIGSELRKGEPVTEKPAGNLELSAVEKQWLSWLSPLVLSTNVDEKVRKAVDEFVLLCRSIKTFNSFDSDMVFWPGNAQWGRLLEAARLCASKKDLHSMLFEGETPIIKTKKESKTALHGDTKFFNPDPEWNYEASLQGDTLRKWIMSFIDDNSLSDKETKIALQELIKRCKDKTANRNWLKEGTR